MQITLECELDEDRAQVVLDLSWAERAPHEWNRVGGCAVHLRVGDWKAEGRFSIDRDALRSFLADARRMYRELEGSATLHDWGNPLSGFALSVLDEGRGIIGVGIRLSRTFWPAGGAPAGAEFPFGNEFVMALGGLVTDQSYLPPVLNAFSDHLFLVDADLEHEAAGAGYPARETRPNAALFVIERCPVTESLRLFMEGARKHGIVLGERALLFSASRLRAGALDGAAGAVSVSRERGVTIARAPADWEGLPELFGLLARPKPGGYTGIVLADSDLGPEGTTVVAGAARPVTWPGGLLLALGGRDRESNAERRTRLAALGRAAILLDRTGTLLEVALHPPDERKLQRLANAAADVGLRTDVRAQTGESLRGG